MEASLHIPVGGTVNADTQIYIERKEDSRLVEFIEQGQFVNILTARQMGKSSLMIHALPRLHDLGFETVIVDIAGRIGTPLSQHRFYQDLLCFIARELRVPVDTESIWHSLGGASLNERFIEILREIHSKIDKKIIIFLDEIDVIVEWSFDIDELFTAIRNIYNNRTIEKFYADINFCIIGAILPNDLIRSKKRTPYNIAANLELKDFSVQSQKVDFLKLIKKFNQHGIKKPDELLARILYWTGGHPYLTMKLSSRIIEEGLDSEESLDKFINGQRGSGDLWNDNNISWVANQLYEKAKEMNLFFDFYERLLKDQHVSIDQSLEQNQLRICGIVKNNYETGSIVIRNRLYRNTFDKEWLNTLRPRDKVERYKWIAAAVGSVSFAIVSLLLTLYISVSNRIEARAGLASLNVEIGERDGGEGGGSWAKFSPSTSQGIFDEALELIEELEEIEEIKISSEKIESLKKIEGLELSHIEWLDLSQTSINDLKPLENLKGLVYLDISDTKVEDVNFLGDLKSLEWLDISGTDIDSIEFVEKIFTLQELYMNDTQVNHINKSICQNEIRILSMNDTDIINIEDILPCKSLEKISIQNTNLTFSEIDKLEKDIDVRIGNGVELYY